MIPVTAAEETRRDVNCMPGCRTKTLGYMTALAVGGTPSRLQGQQPHPTLRTGDSVETVRWETCLVRAFTAGFVVSIGAVGGGTIGFLAGYGVGLTFPVGSWQTVYRHAPGQRVIGLGLRLGLRR